MIIFGRGIRWENDYVNEVEFSKKAGFNFMQVWYYQGDILINSNGRNKVELIKDVDFPIILHAVLEADEFESEIHKIIEILNSLSQGELIIHPVSHKSEITKESIQTLDKALKSITAELKEYNISLFVENNCKMTDLNYSINDIRYIYERNEEVDLLLDIAHIDSYSHLKQIVEIRKPKMLHIADKHFNIEHEHLPIGQGALNFEIIFKEYLKNFEGKIILEIDGTDEEIENSLIELKKLLG